MVLAGITITLGNLRAQEVGSPHQGLRIARTLCAECHLVENMVGQSPNRDAASFEKIANIPGMTSTALAAALQTSHERMPNVIIKGGDLSDVYRLHPKLEGTSPSEFANYHSLRANQGNPFNIFNIATFGQ